MLVYTYKIKNKNKYKIDLISKILEIVLINFSFFMIIEKIFKCPDTCIKCAVQKEIKIIKIYMIYLYVIL